MVWSDLTHCSIDKATKLLVVSVIIYLGIASVSCKCRAAYDVYGLMYHTGCRRSMYVARGSSFSGFCGKELLHQQERRCDNYYEVRIKTGNLKNVWCIWGRL
jgi:hypothetical protein